MTLFHNRNIKAHKYANRNDSQKKKTEEPKCS